MRFLYGRGEWRGSSDPPSSLQEYLTVQLNLEDMRRLLKVRSQGAILHVTSLRRRYALLLSILTFLFVLRVLGQMLVAFFDIAFLPAMEHWYSGLLPYPALLPIQFLMIAIMALLITDVLYGTGFFSNAKRETGLFLKWFSYLYCLSMVGRYVFTMARYPELRWFGHTIPIWFHMVLAAFIYVYRLYLTRFALEVRGGRGSP